MALTDNIISYWKMDESSDGSGAVARNDSVTTNHLTDNSPYAASAAGKIGNGVDLEASASEYLSIADASQSGLDLSNAFSISFWVKAESLAGTDYVLYKGKTDGNIRAYWVVLSGDTSTAQICVAVSDDGTTNAGHYVTYGTTSSDFPGVGTFYHIVITFTTSTEACAVYLNGVSKATTLIDGSSVGASIYNSAGSFKIGCRETTVPTGFFDGIIDEVGIWSRVLSSTEVTALYNSGNGLTYPFITTSIKTFNGLAKASIKSINGLAIASVKSWNGVT